MPFIKIADRADLPVADEAKEFTCGEKMICVANVAGELSAVDNVCMHRGGPLGQGMIDGSKIVCPWHGWEYDAKTGEVAHNRSMKLKVYRIRVEGEDVMVEVE